MRLHLKSDPRSVEGILLGEDARHYRLVNAKILHAPVAPVELDGEAWWPLKDVLFLQVLG